MNFITKLSNEIQDYLIKNKISDEFGDNIKQLEKELKYFKKVDYTYFSYNVAYSENVVFLIRYFKNNLKISISFSGADYTGRSGYIIDGSELKEINVKYRCLKQYFENIIEKMKRIRE